MKVVRCSWSHLAGTEKALNGPHTKNLEKEKKKKKKAQQRNIANGAK